MATLFELVGYITIDGMEKALTGLDTIEKKVRKSIRPIQRFGQQTQQIGKTLTQTFTVPLALAGGAIIKFGADFQKSMTNSLAIMDKSADKMRGKMETTARNVAKTTTFSAAQAAEAYFFLASAGLDAAQAMEALPRVAKFAQAGNFDLALATDLLTDAQSALGLSSKNTAESMMNLTRISDVLVKANTIANASVQQFSESLTNKAGAALRLLGKEVEEGVAVLAVFADQGTKGADAGTKLDIVLRDLQKASISNKKAFEEANIAVFDQEGEMRNLADIIEDIEKRFEGLSDEQRRAELMTLGFTDKSVNATAALLGTSDAIRAYQEALESASGITQEVADKQLESLAAQFEIVKSRLIDVALEFADTLLPIIADSVIPVVESLIEKLASLAKWFTSLPAGVQKFVIGLTAFVAIAGPALIIIGKLISSITLVTTVLKAAKLAMVAFNATLLVNPFSAVILGVVAVTGAIIGLRNEYKKLQQEHEAYTAMTADQAAQKEFITGVQNLMKNLQDLSGTIKNEADLTEHLGDQIDGLVGKAREMGFEIEGNTEKRLRAINIISQELQSVVDATGKLVKYTNEKKKDTEETEKSTKATKKDMEIKEEWANKLRTQGKEGIALLKERQKIEVENARKNKENAATISAINRFYANQIKALEKEITEDKAKEEKERQELALETRDAELSYIETLKIETLRAANQNLKALEFQIAAEKRLAEQSLTNAVEVQQAKILIDKKYYAQLHELRRQDAENNDTNNQFLLNAERTLNDQKTQFVLGFFDQLMKINQMRLQNEVMRIDQERAKNIDHIKSTVKDKTQQEKEIDKINQDADKKKKELLIKQAKADKAAAIFDIVVNTASGAIAAYKAMAGIPYVGPYLGAAAAAAVGIFGGIQAGIVAARPLPELADGAFIPQTQGGVPVIVGEGKDDEVVLPMRKGADAIARSIVSRVGGTLLPESAQILGGSFPGVNSSSQTVSEDTGDRAQLAPVILQVGTLIANDDGLDELNRRLIPFRVSEGQRRGYNTEGVF